MKHNDTQSGLPEIVYKDTKAAIEALTAPVEGMIAYATDTHMVGNYNGTAWGWINGMGGRARRRTKAVGLRVGEVVLGHLQQAGGN